MPKQIMLVLIAAAMFLTAGSSKPMSSREQAVVAPPAQEAERSEAREACAAYTLPAERVIGSSARVQLGAFRAAVCGLPYGVHQWHLPRDAEPFPALLAAATDKRRPLSFLHARTSPNGTRRIVASGPPNETSLSEGSFVLCVRLFNDGPEQPWPLYIPFNVRVRYAGCDGLPVEGVLGDVAVHHPTGKVKVYAGQPDPEDASRFYFPFEYDGVSGRVIARLTDDDSISLSVEPPTSARCLACRQLLDAGPPPD